MRIIAGEFRGRTISMVPSDDTKETSDKVRGAVFNSLSNFVHDSIVLDLFSGSGAYGLEAISRGARKAYMVDSNKVAVKVINENKKALKIEEKATILNLDYLVALEKFKQENIIFDIVILDPPYAKGLYESAIEQLETLVHEDTIIVCEMHKDNHLADEILSFKAYKEKVYGIKKIKYYERVF
ncbi:N6-adenine-specific methylase [Alteracholeplasma palmae J233]|uniref:N6-adenine-specific methylase n=1 Tax=Alteracholeplasma palmae (strain ATCC 49389 / J233) TaxID=1318466 RepID=U4KQA4_ALTPJ|nr:16S rRNA (guanine(966)-N(2))-methyltransferase RsmD [Alteracholeplasma palmae]CCV64465.1 N6-adenine-specific methylase [Alteracholeplasma palmae J233]